MKYLPCSFCREPALGTRKGILLSAGQCPDPTLRYACKRCGRVTILTSVQFSQLPTMTPEQIAAASCDIDHRNL